MYGLSLSKIPYADFPDTFIYVHSLIENLIFEVIILIDVCHFDQAVAHRCFVRTILQVSLSSCLFLLTFSMAGSKKKKKKSKWRFRKRRCLASLPNSNSIVPSLLKTQFVCFICCWWQWRRSIAVRLGAGKENQVETWPLPSDWHYLSLRSWTNFLTLLCSLGGWGWGTGSVVLY